MWPQIASNDVRSPLIGCPVTRKTVQPLVVPRLTPLSCQGFFYESSHSIGMVVDHGDFSRTSWLRRLMNKTSAWTTIAKQEHMDPYKLLLYGTAKLKKIRRHIQNTFWRDVLDSLIELNKSLNLTSENIITEPLWYSDYTKFKTTIVLQWEQRGLRFIGDLFNKDNGNLLTREEIKLQYRISMSFLCYESLIRSLPHEVRNATHASFERPNIPFRLQLFINKYKLARYCYS